MNFSTLEQFIFRKMAETKLPSVTAASGVEKRNDLVSRFWHEGPGKCNPCHNPNTLWYRLNHEILYRSGNLKLVELGKLSLDDPVEKFFPFPIQPLGELVRIKHLLSHTSGIPALAMSESASRNKSGTGDHWLPVASHADLLTFIQDAGDWAMAKPGERWFYFNEGYILLGHLIEICSGQPYFDYIRQNILQPLGMARTYFFPDEVKKDHDAAVPYLIANDGRQIPSDYPYSPNLAKGGIISNLHDMASYVSMFLHKGEFQGKRLISKDSLHEMMTPRIPTPAKETSFGSTLYAYGLGIFPEFLGRKLYGHGGSVRVATSYMGFLPEDELGVVVLANGGGYSPLLLGAYTLAAALGTDPEELPFIRREKLLKDLSGSYQTYKGTMRARVRKTGDMLTLTIEDKLNPMTLSLSPHDLAGDPIVFQVHARDAKINIEFYQKNGQWTMVYERYAFRKTGSS